jgi:hypothetical protein
MFRRLRFELSNLLQTCLVNCCVKQKDMCTTFKNLVAKSSLLILLLLILLKVKSTYREIKSRVQNEPVQYDTYTTNKKIWLIYKLCLKHVLLQNIISNAGCLINFYAPCKKMVWLWLLPSSCQNVSSTVPVLTEDLRVTLTISYNAVSNLLMLSKRIRA